MSVKVCVFFVDYVCSALWAVSLWSIGLVTTLCVCAYRGQRFPKDMSLAALHQAECLLAPGHRGIGWLDGWLKKGHAHHINSPSLCHLRGCVALQRWSRVVLIHGLEQALCSCVLYSARRSSPGPGPQAFSKCDQSAFCVWWMGSLWPRDQEVEGKRDPGSQRILCTRACPHTDTRSVFLYLNDQRSWLWQSSTAGEYTYMWRSHYNMCLLQEPSFCCQSSICLLLG